MVLISDSEVAAESRTAYCKSVHKGFDEKIW